MPNMFMRRLEYQYHFISDINKLSKEENTLKKIRIACISQRGIRHHLPRSMTS